MIPRRVMFDSNIFDALLADELLRCLVASAVAEGRIEVVTTHVQEDQIAMAPTAKRLPWMVQRNVSPTYGLVLGVSRLGMARLSGEDDEAVFERLTGGSRSQRRSTDALIALTALRDGVVLVTNDRQLTRSAKREGVEVWSSDDLQRCVTPCSPEMVAVMAKLLRAARPDLDGEDLHALATIAADAYLEYVHELEPRYRPALLVSVISEIVDGLD